MGILCCYSKKLGGDIIHILHVHIWTGDLARKGLTSRSAVFMADMTSYIYLGMCGGESQ